MNGAFEPTSVSFRPYAVKSRIHDIRPCQEAIQQNIEASCQ